MKPHPRGGKDRGGMGRDAMRAIYKICGAAEWAEARRTGTFVGSDIDRRDGFIHFSTRDQVAETAARYFSEPR